MKESFYKFCVSIIKPFIKMLYPYEVKGKENIENISGGYILCSNHLSNVDPIFLALTHKRPIFFMAKIELFKNKLLARFFSCLGVFPIKRGKADKEALNYALGIPTSGKVLGIFVEGTRSKTGEFLRPKSGATVLANKSKSDIVPVCITGGGSNCKVNILKKTIIYYGKPIKFEKILFEENDRKGLKNSTNLIMENIKNLRSNKVGD